MPKIDHQYQLSEPKRLDVILSNYIPPLDKSYLYKSAPSSTSIISESPYSNTKPEELMNSIAKDFNQNRPSSVTTSKRWLAPFFSFFSFILSPFQRIQPGKMMLVTRNNQPEIVLPNDQMLRKRMTFDWYTTTKFDPAVDQNTPIVGKFGHYIINVPLGYYAKISLGANNNQLLGEGRHVIHNQNISFDTQSMFIKQTETYINYNDIHIFNIPPGRLAKIKIGQNQYYFLQEGHHAIRNPNLIFNVETDFIAQNTVCISHGNQHLFNIPAGYYLKIQRGQKYEILGPGEHYINDGTLNYNQQTDLISQTTAHINHGNLHILNIPQGTFALVKENNIPKILTSGQYVVDCQNFQFDETKNLINVNTPYICHQNIHRITVAPGHIAFISVDNETKILYGQDEPYVFESNNFSIYSKDNQYTFDQNTKHISFNGLHYVLPEKGEVAVFYDGGELILKSGTNKSSEDTPSTNSFVLESPTAKFSEFLDLRIQTVEFPSPELIQQRVKDGITPQNARTDKFKTADGINVAVRFVVTYHINDAALALSKFKSRLEIERHIEKLVMADMNNAISSTLLCNLATSMQSKAQKPASTGTETQDSKKTPVWQDVVKNKLHEDFKDIGIVLERLNIEETDILDTTVKTQIEEQSAAATKAQAQRAIMEINNELAQQKALQERALAQMEQETKAATDRVKAELGTQQAELQTKLAEIEAERARKIALIQKQSELDQQKIAADLANTIVIQTANANREAKQLEAQGTAQTLKATAEVLQSFPAYLQMQIVTQLCEAMKSSNYIEVMTMLGKDAPLSILMNLWQQLSAQNNPNSAITLGAGISNMTSSMGVFSKGKLQKSASMNQLTRDDQRSLPVN